MNNNSGLIVFAILGLGVIISLNAIGIGQHIDKLAEQLQCEAGLIPPLELTKETS